MGIDKGKDEEGSQSLLSVIEDDVIVIEEEKELSSTNGIVVNKENDEQGNESLQSIIEDGQLAIEEENNLDGENEDPITDKTHDLNRSNNNSNNKLSEKSKGVETRGSYIFESPTEEKQMQNGIGENIDENVEIKTKKTKKKSKKSESKKDDSIIEDKSIKGDADEQDDTSTQTKPA